MAVWITSIVTRAGTLFNVDAGRGEGKRYLVTSDELLTAFSELQAQTRVACNRMALRRAVPNLRGQPNITGGGAPGWRVRIQALTFPHGPEHHVREAVGVCFSPYEAVENRGYA